MRTPMICVAALSVSLTACSTSSRTVASATEAEVCRQMGGALPTRSRQDTAQTVQEITTLYATFAAVCPDWAHLVPE